MKKFVFPLNRVLDWRRTQAAIEEMKLSRLHSELHEIESRIGHARAEQADSERELHGSGTVTGDRLAAHDSFKKSVAAECTRLEALAQANRRKIAQQLEAVVARRRDARLLEKVERKRLDAWKADFNREMDREADERYASRYQRRTSFSSPASPEI